VGTTLNSAMLKWMEMAYLCLQGAQLTPLKQVQNPVLIRFLPYRQG